MHVTPCQCHGAGWCERHQCEKSEYWWQLCRRREDWFRLWEQGRGPGQQPAAIGDSVSTVCLHRGPVLREVPCLACRGQVRVKVFGCRIHIECTLGRMLADVACCAACADFQSSEAP
jgi:hypothetical protein